MAKFQISKRFIDCRYDEKIIRRYRKFRRYMLYMERDAKKPVVHQSPKANKEVIFREFLN